MYGKIIVVMSVCAVGLACALQGAEPANFPSELVDFGPASKTPLFTGGGQGTWDRDLRERGWITRDGGRYNAY